MVYSQHETDPACLVDACYRNAAEAEADATIKAMGMLMNAGGVEDVGYELRFRELAKDAPGGA